MSWKKNLYRLFESKDFIENKNEITEFTNEMYRDGYVYVECTDEIKQVYENLIKISKSFFDLSREEKMKFKPRPHLPNVFQKKDENQKKDEKEVKIEDRMYKKEVDKDYEEKKRIFSMKRDQREFYDVLETSNIFYNEEFSTHSQTAYKMFYQYSLRYLEQLLFPFQCDFEHIKSLLGPSNTTLRMLKYNYVGEDLKETCLRHTDMGLITLAVCLDHGLEMKNFKTHEWNDVEENAPVKPCLILFCGESLSRLTGGYFKAILHRVYTKADRYSFPFFFRARNDAVLDIKSLKSDVFNYLIDSKEIELLNPITVDQLNKLTTLQYRFRELPEELGNYKKDKYWDFLFDVKPEDEKK